MIESKHHINPEHITMIFNKEWYCFPFIILEDEPSFMNLVWAYFGYLSNGNSLPGIVKGKSEFYQLVERGSQILIYEYLSSDPRGSFIAFSNLISTNMHDWIPVLNTCKLYNNAPTA